MLIDAQNSCLLVIDIQAKLAPAVHDVERLLDNSRWLIEIAQLAGIPTLTSEQYPAGLGGTVEQLDALLPAETRMSKLHFSCVADESCRARILAENRDQIVIIGMEAHVCVLQTAMQLRQLGKEVFVVADTVASRNPADKEIALQRMAQAGVHIVTREMVAFEWMEKSGTDLFRTVSKNYLR